MGKVISINRNKENAPSLLVDHTTGNITAIRRLKDLVISLELLSQRLRDLKEELNKKS